jgi:hypothetical protein
MNKWSLCTVGINKHSIVYFTHGKISASLLRNLTKNSRSVMEELWVF